VILATSQDSHSNTVKANDCIRCRYIGQQVSPRTWTTASTIARGSWWRGWRLGPRWQIREVIALCASTQDTWQLLARMLAARGMFVVQVAARSTTTQFCMERKNNYVTAVNMVDVKVSKMEAKNVEINYEAVAKEIFETFKKAEVEQRARDLEDAKKSIKEHDLDGGTFSW
jgi:hypothetical protein